jgi:Mlc titration factor MtfA (ptsG expression regulator)
MRLMFGALLLLAGLALAVAGWLWGPPLWAEQRRARLRRRPFPPAWREILRQRMPYFAQLPADLQLQLKKHIQVFVAEKPFIGCNGLEITEAMRVLIAAQAGLLLLNRRAGMFRGLRQVLVYPGAFVVDRVQNDAAGLVREGRQVLLGESWQQGQVILSWDDVLAGAADPADGHNVVIHEFAHQLDQENGAANGAPFLGRRERYARWAAIMSAAFLQLQQAVAHGEPTLIDAYGATSPAEFFAVASELFFERPQALADAQPALFSELAGYYRVNPLSWH